MAKIDIGVQNGMKHGRLYVLAQDAKEDLIHVVLNEEIHIL